MILTENLGKQFDDFWAVSDVKLDVKPGKILALLGQNGAGKTTLILHFNGILRGTGEINIAGLNLENNNIGKIRSKIGLVFQNPEDQLFSPTVFDDVAFGPLNMKLPKEEVIKRTTEALEMVEMSGFENHSSHHLSEGEKKRISIATVLSVKPEILVLDEPTSNLDPKHRRELIALLKKIQKTIIIVSHDLEAVLELCDRTVLMNGGKIVADGKTEELLNNEAVAYYFGAPGMIRAGILLEAIQIEPNCASETVEIVIEDLSGYSYIRIPILKCNLDEFQKITTMEQLLRFLKNVIVSKEEKIVEELESIAEYL